MRLFNYELPCGCEGRKEVVWDKGNVGFPEAAILTLTVGVLMFAYYRGKS